MIPALRRLDAVEFEHNDAFGRLSFERLRRPAAHANAAAVARNRARRELGVFAIQFGISDVDLGDDVSGHLLSSSFPGAYRQRSLVATARARFRARSQGDAS